jgi:hypothetical protein
MFGFDWTGGLQLLATVYLPHNMLTINSSRFNDNMVSLLLLNLADILFRLFGKVDGMQVLPLVMPSVVDWRDF